MDLDTYNETATAADLDDAPAPTLAMFAAAVVTGIAVAYATSFAINRYNKFKDRRKAAQEA
jgi:hypothetical protein